MSGAAYMGAAPTVGVERRERLDRLGDSRVKPGEDHPDDGRWRVICLQPLTRLAIHRLGCAHGIKVLTQPSDLAAGRSRALGGRRLLPMLRSMCSATAERETRDDQGERRNSDRCGPGYPPRRIEEPSSSRNEGN